MQVARVEDNAKYQLVTVLNDRTPHQAPDNHAVQPINHPVEPINHPVEPIVHQVQPRYETRSGSPGHALRFPFQTAAVNKSAPSCSEGVAGSFSSPQISCASGSDTTQCQSWKGASPNESTSYYQSYFGGVPDDSEDMDVDATRVAMATLGFKNL